MLKNSNLALRLSRFGFRSGWLYYRNEKGLFRFRAWPQLEAEYLQAKDWWRKMDRVLRDELIRGFWFDLHRHRGVWLLPCGDHFKEKATGQVYMQWWVETDERRFVYGIHHWRRFLAPLPGTLLKSAARLECDFFSALELFLQAPTAMDLVAHNSMLATMIARHWEFDAVGRTDWEGVQHIARKRRRDILGWLGYRAAQSWVNTLEHIDCHRLWGSFIPTVKCCLYLLGEPEIAPYLIKVGDLNEDMVYFLCDSLTRQWLEPRQLIQASTVSSGSLLAYFKTINWLLKEGLIDLEGAKAVSRYKPDRRSLKRFQRYLKAHELSPAPVPISSDVRHISSLGELIDEGEVMEHCVGSPDCLGAALSSGISFYRVIAPVRATLAIFNGPMGDEGKQLLDIKGPRNVAIPLEHIKQIAKAFSPEVNFDKWLNATSSERYLWWRFVV